MAVLGLFVAVAEVVDGLVDVAVDLGEGDTATRHDALGDGVEGLEGNVLETCCCAALLERGDEVAGEAGSVDVDADAQHGGGVDHAVDANLAVVAHEQAAELESRALKALAGVVPEFDFAVVVLEVAGRGAAADVAPLADDGVAQESLVGLVAVPDEDGVLDLAADFAMRPERCRTVDLGADAHLGVMASGKAATDAGTLHHLDVGTDVDGTLVGVEHGALDIGSRLDEDAGGVADDGVGRRQRLGLASGGDALKILSQHQSVELKDVVQVLDDEGQRLGIEHAGVVAGVIVMGTAVEGDEFLAHHQGLAGLQGKYLLCQLGGGDDVPCHHEVGGAACVQREFLLQVTHGEIAVGGLAEQGLPLLADGGDAHAQHGGGTCIGEWHQVLAHLVVVKQDDVACCFLHLELSIKIGGKSTRFSRIMLHPWLKMANFAD